MAKEKRKVPGLNATSTADISFILLIFFLVTTSMDTDTGLARRLPPPPENENSEAEIDVKERNVLNAYHKRVRETISPYLSREEQEWLKDYTRPV